MRHHRLSLWRLIILQLCLWQLALSLPRFNSSASILHLPTNITDRPYPVNDPFIWYREGEHEALKFHNYKSWLPQWDVIEVLSEASYSAGNVQLVLIPRDNMNWWAWSTALWGMRITMRDHQMFFGWDFKVISREFGEIGYGTLGEIRRDLAKTSKSLGTER